MGYSTCWRLSRANKHTEELLAAPLRKAVRPRSPGSPVRNQRTLAREGPRRGRRPLGCPRLGRLARTSSHIAKVVENGTWGWKSRVNGNEKVNTIKDKFNRFNCGSLQSPMALYIYREGRSHPIRVETLTKPCQNTTPNSYLAG
jgi:hypothetical protein